MNKLWYRSRGLRKLEMRLGRNIVKDFIKNNSEERLIKTFGNNETYKKYYLLLNY